LGKCCHSKLYKPAPVSTAIHYLFNEDFKIYTNPTKNEIHINTNREIIEISILDLTGKQVLKTFSGKVLNINSLQNGMYLAEINDKERKTIREKFVIHK